MTQDQAASSAREPDWHAAYTEAMAKFTAETRTTSFLVGLLREAQTPCQRCGGMTGSVVLVVGDERTFVCGICVARTPAFEERLATRMREDKPILDRLADDRPIHVKDQGAEGMARLASQHRAETEGSS